MHPTVKALAAKHPEAIEALQPDHNGFVMLRGVMLMLTREGGALHLRKGGWIDDVKASAARLPGSRILDPVPNVRGRAGYCVHLSIGQACQLAGNV